MAAPERFAEKSDLILQRGRRPYMALFDVCRDAPILPQLEHKRTLRGHHECVAIDPKRSLCGRIVLTETAAVCFYKSPLGKVT